MLCRQTYKETGSNELLLRLVLLRCNADRQAKQWIDCGLRPLLPLLLLLSRMNVKERE